MRLPAEPARGQPPLTRRGDVHREGLDVLVGRCGLAEAQRIVRATIVDAVEVDDVEMHIEVQRGAEPLDRRDGTTLAQRAARRLAVPPRDAAKGDAQDTIDEIRPARQQPAAFEGNREHPLARRHPRDHTVHPVRGGLRHTSPGAARAEPTRLAGEQHQPVVIALGALQPRKPLLGATTPKVGLELTGHEPGKLPILLSQRPHKAREPVRDDLAQVCVRRHP